MSGLRVATDFKEAEIGVIPQEWQVATARDVLVINRGRVISHRDLVERPGPYPVYSSQTKDNGVMGYLDTFDFEGDYLTWTTDGANAGTVFFRTGKFNCTNVCGAGKARNSSEVSPHFYAYFLNTVAWKHVSHVGNPKLMSGPFGSIPVVVPPLAEQQAIAAALLDADGVVAGLERVIAKKRLIKQGAMQDLLTARRRLPGFSGEWGQRKLGTVAMLQRGFDLPNSTRRDGSYPVVYSNGVMASHSAFMCEGPGVVTGRSGTIGNVTFVAGRYWPHNTALWVKNFFGNSPRFIYYLLEFIDLRRFASGSGVPTLNRNDAHDDLVSVPQDVDEQNAICAALDDMDAEIQTLESRLAKARAVKEGMMQNLLTGRVRLV